MAIQAVVLSGNAADRPTTGRFQYQVFVAADTGDISIWDGSVWQSAGGSESSNAGALSVVSDADQEVINTTLADSTQLVLNLAASSKYTFRAKLFFLNDGATEGVKVALSGTVGVGDLAAQVSIYDDALNSLVAFALVTALNSSVGAGISSGDNFAVIEGSIETTTAGTLLVQFAQNAIGASAGVHLKENSAFEIIGPEGVVLTAHATNHEENGSDELFLEDLGTAETDTSRVPQPNGTGGIVWGELVEDVTKWDPDCPPASAGADDDEFADASGGVPSGWTEVDHGTSLTVTEDEAGLKLTATAAQGWAGIYKTIPVGNFTIWTKVSLIAITEQNFVTAGLVLWENAASSTGDLRTFNLGLSAADSFIEVTSWSSYNVFTAQLNIAAIATDGVYPSHVYLRIRRTGTTYGFDLSTDGISWVRFFNTSSLGITPTHYGPAINTFDFPAAQLAARFPFFRYKNSDVGLVGLMEGDRVKLFRK